LSDEANNIIIFDTTVCDGEQYLEASLKLDEKARITSLLETLGVNVIEAELPIAFDG
jgi:isopropylmalate/homocitrate/citramalate synthase